MTGAGLPVAATDHRDDLQIRRSPLPVEAGIGTQVDTTHPHVIDKELGQDKFDRKRNSVNGSDKGRQPHRKIQILECIQVQVANLSLEEKTLDKCTNIGVASPIQTNISEGDEKCHVSLIEQAGNKSVKEFESYLHKKLAHL